MPKMNYSKTEESFDEGMRKMEVGKLFEMTDTNQEAISNKKNKTLLKKLAHQLKSLERRNVQAFQAAIIKADIDELKRLQHLESLKGDDLDRAIALKTKIDLLNEEINKQTPISAEEKAVELERLRQINKRFNIQGHWLPL